MTASQMVSFQAGDERLEAYLARSARKLDAELDRHGVPHDVKIYPGARHSFFNDRGRTYDPTASEDSWRRTLAFFKKHLS